MATRETEENDGAIMTMMVPKWDGSSEGIRRYIDSLDEVRELNIFPNTEHLIYASLCKSNRPEIYSSLDRGQKGDITKFAKYMASTFGLTTNELKRKFLQMRQEEGEYELYFFNRVQKAFFESRSIKVIPSGSNFSQDNKDEIELVFTSGLRNPEVKKAILTRATEIEYDKLARVAKRIGKSVREMENRVYSVDVDDY